MSNKLSPGMVGEVIEIEVAGFNDEKVVGRLSGYTTGQGDVNLYFEGFPTPTTIKSRSIKDVTTWNRPREIRIEGKVQVEKYDY